MSDTQKVTPDEIKKVADLSQIALSDAEKVNFATDVESVLQYFDRLSDVDTEGVEAVGHITGMQNVLRQDRAQPMDEDARQAMMGAVPEVSDKKIVVKGVL